MTDPELINKFLYYLARIHPGQASVSVVLKEDLTDQDKNACYRIQERLLNENLCLKTGNGLMITQLGMDITNSGGYELAFEQLKKEWDYEEEKERIEFENSKYNLKNSKWDYRMRWITFAIAIIALAVSIVALIK